jgi:phage terminase large subunit-like protein
MTELSEQDGFDQVIEHLQTTDKMNDPIGLTEKLILDGRLRHGGHKVLRWCVSNAITYKDTGGRRRFDKKAIREKIDLAVAKVMAVGRLMLVAGGSSAYENHGVFYAEDICGEEKHQETEEIYA